MHRGADAVTVLKPDVIPHPNLIPVVKDRRAWQAEQQGISQPYLTLIVVKQRSQAAADAKVEAHARLGRVVLPHPLAFLFRDHFEGQLIVIAEEDAPLAVLGDGL